MRRKTGQAVCCPYKSTANTLGRGPAPVHPHCRHRRHRRAIRPGTPIPAFAGTGSRVWHPRPAIFFGGRMKPPTEALGEASPASEAPEVIYLPPPPANDPAPRPGPQPGRHTGRMKGRHFGPRPVDDPRSERFELRCTPALLESLRAKSKAAGLSASAYLCALIDGDPGPRAHRSKPGPDAASEARIVAALGRSGNNLNQLLQKVNACDFRGAPELMEMYAEMKAAHAAHHELVAAIKAEMGL
jgi:hypothetical protein